MTHKQCFLEECVKKRHDEWLKTDGSVFLRYDFVILFLANSIKLEIWLWSLINFNKSIEDYNGIDGCSCS